MINKLIDAALGMVQKKAPESKRVPMKVQSLIFSKEQFKNASVVKAWAKENGFAAAKIQDVRKAFIITQESKGGFKKMRTVSITKGVQAIVGKMQPTRGSVHVNSPDWKVKKVNSAQTQVVPVSTVDDGIAKDGLVEPAKTARELHDSIMSEGNVGGTRRDGSVDEKFVFGPMTFDIDKARDIAGTQSNADVKVSPDWSHKINVDTDAAMKGKSERPVFIAQIPTTNGNEKLLIDGHHRMHRAMVNGDESVPGYVFSPEDTLSLIETHPDRMKEMQDNLKKSTDGSTEEDVVNEEDAGVEKENARSSGGTGDNVLYGLYDMQELVSGMDWELEHETTDPDIAHEIAFANLQDDPDHYKKLRRESDGYDYSSGFGIEKDTQEGEESPMNNGLCVDIGSGQNREAGYIGLDLEKHDHGTVVHDANLGLPFPDKSAKSVILRNALEYMDCLSDDPKPLLAEIQRILMPGGQFIYQGGSEIKNQPESLVQTWSEKFNDIQAKTKSEKSGEERLRKADGKPMFRQEFARVAVPDAATANDAEPRIGIAQYDMLPADALLAMDALGYYWSDATSSGRGNRMHGYPSQGALVNGDQDNNVGVDKGGPGSGPAGGGSSHYQEHKDKAKNEDKMNMLERQAEKNRQKTSERRASVGKNISIFKADNEKRIVYGVVLAPNEVDLQGDWMTLDEIEKAAHFYMMNSRTIGKNHEKQTVAVPVESYLAPIDFESDGQYGGQEVKKGSWILGVKVQNDEDWEKIKSGEFTGFSVGGLGVRSDSAGPDQE